MKAKFLRLLLLSSFVLVGCSNPFAKKENPEPEQEQPSGGQQDGGNPQDGGEGEDKSSLLKRAVHVQMEALLTGSEDNYELEFIYDDSLFLKDAEVYDKDLSLLSFGASMAGTFRNWAESFLDDTDFNDSYQKDYEGEPTAETLAYSFAHKTIEDNELFAVIIRGHEYKKEWSNNLEIGADGDHMGWLYNSMKLCNELKDYINDHKGEKTVKLWMVGYSRAGAIANMVSSLIFRGTDISVSAKNMYVYTFEAPAPLTEEHAIKYNNVHNIVNSADIVAHIPPEQYGLYRCGVDFEIYDANVSEIVKYFDNNIDIPAYINCSPNGSQITNDIDFTQYILDSIFTYNLDDTKDAQTREDYVDHYEDGLSYFVGLLFSFSAASRTAMMAGLSDYSVIIPIMMDSSGVSFANYVKTYLDADHIEYDDEKLVSACKTLQGGLTTIFSGLLSVYMSDYKTNLTRVLDMHYPEVTYCLLNNAHAKLGA